MSVGHVTTTGKAHMSTGQRLDVWYDGNCKLCRQSRSWCEQRADRSRLGFIDFRAVPDDRLPVPRHKLETSMWVQTLDGQLLSGFDGWRRILSTVPRWRWLAQLSGVPPFRWLGPPLYRLVAHLRNHLPT